MESLLTSLFVKVSQASMIIFGMLCFVACLIMTFSETTFKKLSLTANTYYSFRKKTKWLEIDRDIETAILPHLKTVFAVMLLCASYALYSIMKNFDVLSLVNIFSSKVSRSGDVLSVIFSSVKIMLIVFLLSSIAICLFALFNQRSFLSLRQMVDFRFSTRKSTRSLDILRDCEESFLRYRVLIGIIGIAVSVIMIITAIMTLTGSKGL
jgi:hypothetical protein